MLVSYGATLANKNSRYARTIINQPAFVSTFPGVALDPKSQAVDAWDIAGSEGGADALGVLGGATGKGAHIQIWDDLIKNRQDAESETIRDRTWDGLIDDLMSRSEPGGALVLMATRWHQDDPTGRMLKLIEDSAKCNGPVVRLRLVALPETDDDLEADRLAGIERDPSGALWPERYPLKVLEAIRERSGPYSWSSLYQQRPTPAEGGLFKRVWFEPSVERTPPIKYAVRYWDLAMSAKTSADYTVGVKVGQATDGHFYILDVVRKQIEWGDLTEWMASVILADGMDVSQGVEDKGFMSRAISELNADPRLHGYQVWGYPVDTDKVTRALPVAAKLASGNLHMVTAHWNGAFVDEVCSFPQGAHDDQVDGLSGAWSMLDPETGVGELHLATEDDYGIGAY
jgi:predicted phage terminase large subunit-like protein